MRVGKVRLLLQGGLPGRGQLRQLCLRLLLLLLRKLCHQAVLLLLRRLLLRQLRRQTLLLLLLHGEGCHGGGNRAVGGSCCVVKLLRLPCSHGLRMKSQSLHQDLSEGASA